ncbi:MAG TPA: DUF4149 domain-containing protein [Blastocatellia bacterium]
MSLQGAIGRQEGGAAPSVRVKSAESGQALTLAQRWQAYFEFLILVVWLGAMIFFSFGVAQSAFAVLPTKHFAALIVTSTLTKVELIGLISGPLLALSFIVGRAGLGKGAAFLVRIILVSLMTASAAISHFSITPTMVGIRNSMPDAIDLVPVTDPTRMRFDQLHQYSVGLMSVAMLAGLVLLFMTVQAWINPRSAHREV